MPAAVYGCWKYLMSQVCVVFLAIIVVLVKPVEASTQISHLLDHSSMATAYSGESDLVTSYNIGMARIRLKLAMPADETNAAVALEPRLLRPEFRARTWRAADGSLLQ